MPVIDSVRKLEARTAWAMVRLIWLRTRGLLTRPTAAIRGRVARVTRVRMGLRANRIAK